MQQEAAENSGETWKETVQEWRSSETRIRSDKQRAGSKFGNAWPVFPRAIQLRRPPMCSKVRNEHQA